MFQYYPVAQALLGSLETFNPFTHEHSGFAGAANYIDLVTDPQFRAALLNTRRAWSWPR